MGPYDLSYLLPLVFFCCFLVVYNLHFQLNAVHVQVILYYIKHGLETLWQAFPASHLLYCCHIFYFYLCLKPTIVFKGDLKTNL